MQYDGQNYHTFSRFEPLVSSYCSYWEEEKDVSPNDALVL